MRIRHPVAFAVVVVTVAPVLATAAPAAAWVPEETPRRAVNARVRETTRHPAARGATAGILVRRGGRTIVALGAGRPLIPASLTKLATTTAAMHRFGPDHRFTTEVRAVGSGPVAGDLYLVGGGDPTLATGSYRRRRYLPRPTDPVQRPAFASGSPTIEDLAAAVADSGIGRVTGDIVTDETLFDDRRRQAGWLDRYFDGDAEVGLLSALVINEGRVQSDRDRIVPDPAAEAGARLRRALRARGIDVDGGVRSGRAPAGARVVGAVRSPPLAEIVDFINRYSVNHPSEMLLKGLGAADGDSGTTESGVAVVRATLGELGIATDGLIMTDGSGLSVRNRMTARTVARILEEILTGRGEAWEALRKTIPVAGRPGTLFRRLDEPPLAGNLRGKTGLLRGVRALAGWVRGPDLVPWVYVGMYNDGRSASALGGPLDDLGRSLAETPGGAF